MTLDVLENPIVGRRGAADVVLRLQAVDRYDDREARDAAPLGGNLANGTGDELHVDAALREQRQNRRQLAIPHERFAADDGDMEWAMRVDERHDAVDQFLTFEIADFAKREIAAEMIVAVRVATGTVKRAFPGDFDGKRR